MDSIHSGENGDCLVNNPHVESLPSLDDDFGDPSIPPRTGEEDRAELPPVLDRSNYIAHQNFLVGVPIPLTWITIPKDDTNIEVYSGEVGCIDPNRRLVPGLPREDWTQAERDSVLLGLYIFEKNFVEVRRFVETKGMGAILSFYYGEFYKSQDYRRWRECRKVKSKKGVCGEKILSGARQQELLSRIRPRVSEENQTALSEVSKTFNDGDTSLAEYVTSLKAIAGMKILVEAVGIGSGKQDLTGMALEPPKSSKLPEIPIGDACAGLTKAQILRFLGPEYRLSKARSGDLFYLAIWSRLIERGWQSLNPPKSPKDYIVFLVPGVKKFCPRKLVKGVQYYDSVTDIMGEIAKDPTMIDLPTDDVDEKNEDKKNEKHCYLQPRTPNRDDNSGDSTKFTVVDTSLPDGKFLELRNLPEEIEITDGFITRDHSDEEKTDEVSADLEENKNKKSKKARKAKRDSNNNNVGPATKRVRVLAACSKEGEKNNGGIENGMLSSSCQVSSGSSSRESPNLNIDLNLLPPENENDEVSKEVPGVDVPLVNGRRLSTRNRPPTARVLQAHANGYLSVNTRRKGKEAVDVVVGPSKRARVAVAPNESTSSSVASKNEEEADNGSSNGGGDVASERHEANGESSSGKRGGDMSSGEK